MPAHFIGIEKEKRTDLEYRTQERSANAEAMRNRRLTDTAFRERERETNSAAMRNRRSTKEIAREREENALRLQRRREVTELRVQERTRRQESRQQHAVYSTAVRHHENAVKEGPTQVCNCCARMIFKRSITKLTEINLLGAEPEEPEGGVDADEAEPDNPGVQETMVMTDEIPCGVRMTPAEGYRPLSILIDEDTEYLSFPEIFGGTKLEPTF
ncbi:unnamed protein product [Gongylonema pulchrum]|uniref:Helitron_like_N domain-containing protein n=1 Tax=Gongylonema pulchrum TaxID=637853 RepID=A0A183DPP2_9BILA|nr:unnamed protein product [Gongylonema pulchrum]